MPIDPTKPLLQLNVGQPQTRPTGKQKSLPKPKPFSLDHQRAAFGPKFDRPASILERDQSGIELRSDPSALAPERLLVFEVRGAIQDFINAIAKVPGLEFIDQEELESDEQDKKPTVYLLVPDALALSNIVSLWRRWNQGENFEIGFAPWRNVFATLRDIRPWGPQDRVQADERGIIAAEILSMADDERVRLEIELVFRSADARANETEADLSTVIATRGGRVISRCRITDIGYHAILAELPVSSVRSIVEMSQASIAGHDLVMHIRPQSVATTIEIGDAEESIATIKSVAAEHAAKFHSAQPLELVLDKVTEGVRVRDHGCTNTPIDLSD